MKTYEAIVIGGGQAGLPLANNLADKGWSVAVIEREHLGGSCINYGCTPTKTMISSSRVAQTVREAGEFGILTGPPRVDMEAVLSRKDKIVLDWRQNLLNKIESRPNITLYRGEAHFCGDHTVEVNGEELTSPKIFINTGTRSRVPDIEGIEPIPYLTNKTIIELATLPEHLLVIGGSYVGLEFGQMFLRFGSQVSVIEYSEQIISHEDEDVSATLQQALAAEGMRFYLNCEAQQVANPVDGKLVLSVRQRDSGKVEEIIGSHLLIGAGRTPNTEALDLARAGIQTNEHGYIRTNEYLETNVPGIFALGDVKGGPAFTHISYNDYQILYHNLFHEDKKSIQNRLVPYALYTEPELGRVGMSEKAARASGRPLKIGKIPMDWVARAIESGQTEGLMKVIIDAETDHILGAAVLGPQGGELVQTLMALMLAHAPWTVFYQAMFIHPTLSEGFFALMNSVEPA
jgi:pyruvate/2-oxoglutarate dehydrogenase complex dihydrolipoamide dehydrogenase (E3) component